ncbi:MAG: septum formation inhibitor Maf [Betaproteobacteria bacterium]|nr:septum formation inhibitor Maf [Betaproteobacteria bacterium]
MHATVITSYDRSIYLASRSPRRRELLAQIGVKFNLLLFRDLPQTDPEVNEDPLAAEAPEGYVVRVCRAKAEAGWRRLQQRSLPRGPVLSADTTVTIDGHILAKPADRHAAAEMLSALSGRRHEVLTAVALKLDQRVELAVSRTEVEFRTLTIGEIHQYIESGEANDKAGAYAIQGRAGQFIVRIKGSYSGVMGLPLYETAQMIEKIGTLQDRRGGLAG